MTYEHRITAFHCLTSMACVYGTRGLQAIGPGFEIGTRHYFFPPYILLFPPKWSTGWDTVKNTLSFSLLLSCKPNVHIFRLIGRTLLKILQFFPLQVRHAATEKYQTHIHRRHILESQNNFFENLIFTIWKSNFHNLFILAACTYISKRKSINFIIQVPAKNQWTKLVARNITTMPVNSTKGWATMIRFSHWSMRTACHATVASSLVVLWSILCVHKLKMTQEHQYSLMSLMIVHTSSHGIHHWLVNTS